MSLRLVACLVAFFLVSETLSSVQALGSEQGRVRLPDHIDQISVSEALVLERNLYRAIHDGSINVRTYMRGLSKFSRASDLRAAAAPIEQFSEIHDSIVENYAKANVRDRFIELYGGRIGDLRRKANEYANPESRAAVQLLGFLALKAGHPGITEDQLALADQILIERPGTGSRLSPVEEARFALALSVAVKHDGSTYVPLLFEKLERTESPEQRAQLLSATSWVSDAKTYQNVLARIGSDELSAEESRELLRALFANADNRWSGWKWLKENYASVTETLEMNDNDVAGMLNEFCSRKAHREIETFYRSKTYGVTEFPNAVKQALNEIDRCVSFRQQKGNEITSYLAGP